MSDDGTVAISKKEYDRLLRSEAMLGALEAYGVDNWIGYSDAVGSFYDEED